MIQGIFLRPNVGGSSVGHGWSWLVMVGHGWSWTVYEFSKPLTSAITFAFANGMRGVDLDSIYGYYSIYWSTTIAYTGRSPTHVLTGSPAHVLSRTG